MRSYPIPPNESARLSSLWECHILDTPSEQEYNELVELVAQITACPFACISFVDHDRQWFKSSIGIKVTETARDVSFCTYTILQGEVMTVEDTTRDERFAHYPTVVDAPSFRFYAGAPIISCDGHRLGTVCVFDQRPRRMSEWQTRALTIIASQVSRLLELRIRNIAIREQARRQIDMEKKTIQYTLRQHDEERLSIGTELHENFGQVLAACSLYLNMAEELQDGRPFLHKAKEELGKLIGDVRRLSHHVHPMSLHEVSFRDVLTDSVKAIRLRSGHGADLVFHGSVHNLSSAHALTLLRVIVQYLELLHTKKEISKINVEVFLYQRPRLSITYEAGRTPELSAGERVTLNALLNRVESEQGTLYFHSNGIEVLLPEPQAALV